MMSFLDHVSPTLIMVIAGWYLIGFISSWLTFKFSNSALNGKHYGNYFDFDDIACICVLALGGLLTAVAAVIFCTCILASSLVKL